MCRLLATVCPRPMSLVDAVGPAVLAEFVALSRAHRDGWGLGWQSPGGAGVHTSARPADADFDASVAPQDARVVLAHLRWASPGLPVNPENTHPFLREGVVFAHNGTLHPVGPLDNLLSAHRRASLRGTTDSERYFALVLQIREQTADLPTAVLTAARVLRARYPHASINAIVLDADSLVVVNASSDAEMADVAREQSLVLGLPADHVDAYFQLRIATAPSGATVIGSTGFGDLDWAPLPPESVTTFALDDSRVTTTRL